MSTPDVDPKIVRSLLLALKKAENYLLDVRETDATDEDTWKEGGDGTYVLKAVRRAIKKGKKAISPKKE